jgi:hypothetical protein
MVGCAVAVALAHAAGAREWVHSGSQGRVPEESAMPGGLYPIALLRVGSARHPARTDASTRHPHAEAC